MSHWDFGRPTGGQHDTREPADADYPPNLAGGADDEAWPAQGLRPADLGWPVQDAWPDDGGPAEDPWAANRGRPARERWSPGMPEPPGEGENWADNDGDGDGTAPYPITYERDDFAMLGPEPTAPPPEVPWEPWPPAPYPDDPDTPGTTRRAPGVPGGTAPEGAAREGTGTESWLGDDAEERQARDDGRRGTTRRERRGTGTAAPGWPDAELGLPGEAPADWAGIGGGRYAGRSHGSRRWLILAGIVVTGAAVGAAAVLVTSGHPRSQGAGGSAAPPATPGTTPGKALGAPTTTTPSAASGPLTMTQAQGVLAGYTTANNGANAERSDTLLATIETGSSYAIDAALYQMQQAAGTAPFPAFAPAQATYYIPRDEPAAGPRWFVVQVANAFSSAPKKVTSTEYLLFTQSAPGGAWQNAIEPYILPGSGAPQIAVGPDGLATAVSVDAASVAVAPGELPSATAASLDGTGAGQAAIANPGNLEDLSDQKRWQGKLPGGQVTDTHTPAAGADGQEFALQTTDGGALVFYTDAADVTLTPPAGSALNLNVPGLYSPSQSLSQAEVSYLEQFAAYDPPAGGGAPRVVADYSGITGKN
jgi:hypothetical protein